MTARNLEKAAGDVPAAKARTVQEDEDEEEEPEWYTFIRRPAREMDAKRLAWLESRSTGRPHAETKAKRLEWLESMRKYGVLRPPGSVDYVQRARASDAAWNREKLEERQAAMEVLAELQTDAAARLEWMEVMRLRGLLFLPDAIYVNKSNCDALRDSLDINHLLGINTPVEKKEFLAMERLIWLAAMDYWKSKDMCSEYDLLSDNMTMYPVVFEKQTWYHCNLLVRRRGPEYPRILIFVEVKCKWECMKVSSYDVTYCVAPGKGTCYNCTICPPSMGIVHPLRAEFTCGSKDGQKVFHYTIPGTPCFFDVHHDEASTVSSVAPIATTLKSTVSSEATSCSLMNLENCNGLQGQGTEGTGNSIHCSLANQLLKGRSDHKVEWTERFGQQLYIQSQ